MLTDEHKAKIEYLSKYRTVDKDIDRLIMDLEKWTNRATSITNSLDNMPHSKGKSDVVGESVSNVDEIKQKLSIEIKRLREIKEDIQLQIESIAPPKLREVMKRIYFDGDSFVKIAFELNYNYGHVHRLHEQGLDCIKMRHNAIECNTLSVV